MQKPSLCVFCIRTGSLRTIGKLSNLTQALQQEIHNHQQTEEELAKSQESLELRVAERTEELSKQQEILFEGQSLAKFGTTQRDLRTGEGLPR